MIIDWSPTGFTLVDSFGSIIDWVGEYETFVPISIVDIYFKVGEQVYLIGCGNKKYTITAYLGDNEHYILNNKIRVSYTEISRSFNFKINTSQLDKLLAITPAPDPTPVTIYKDGVTSGGLSDIQKRLAYAQKKINNINNI